MDLSVVIPAHNAADTLGAALDAVLGQEWEGEWEVVVVDNRSTDGTAALVRAYAARDPRVRLVSASDRGGASYARNVGIEAAASDHIAACDADDVVESGWLRAMGDGLRRHPCVTGPLDVDELNPRWLVESRGVFPPDRCQTWYGVFPVAPAGNLGIRRDVFDAAGRFDEGLLAMEDHDLALRLRALDVPITFVPEARVHYRYRATPAVLWRQGLTYGRAAPVLFRRVEAAGLVPPPRFAGWRSWVWLAVHLPDLGRATGRARWLYVAGVRIGHLCGSVRARTVFL